MEQLINTDWEPVQDTVPYYRAWAEIGWKWIFPVQDEPFQTHKRHYIDAVQWCDDRDISHQTGDMSKHQVYVKCTTILFTSEEDCLAFTLAYGDLYVHPVSVEILPTIVYSGL
jgi:hypothetical protein